MSALALYGADERASLAHDALYPRDAENRYRVYARIGRELTVLCTTSTPEGVGAALVQIHKDQKSIGRRLADLGQIGVLDVIDRDWIVLPWARSEFTTLKEAK